MDVKVMKYREYKKNTLCGFCEISVNGLRVKDCTHHRKGEKQWISFPSKSYEVDGQTKWTNLLEWVDKADAWKFQDVAREALKKYFDQQKLEQAWENTPPKEEQPEELPF
jgi:hypothetical protein